MDQAIRNKLRNVVTQCRRLLEEAVSQQLQGRYDIYATGKKDEVRAEKDAPLAHLSDEERQARQDILAHFEHVAALSHSPREALEQLIREIAFTHLNRLCAYKMMEVRDVYVGGQRFRESVSKGIKSQGFLFFLAENPEDEERYNSGDQEGAYRHFLNWLGGTLSQEIGVLFSPTDPDNRVYPPQRVLDEVLDLLNSEELKGIWSEDETIGWVYQYFTPKELRDQVRKESQAPRNSYELAFRNQFFTPRYVVEFLTDNTLGRIWYEMRRGSTRLKDECRYLVRRPGEVFLDDPDKFLTDGCRPWVRKVRSGDFTELPDEPTEDELACVSYAFNGYEVAEQAGRYGADLLEWANARLQKFDRTGERPDSSLDLWLMLFAMQRDWRIITESGSIDGAFLNRWRAVYRAWRDVLRSEQVGERSQEELLAHPVYVPHRPEKDPREIKTLDPACGSGHFLLYCFALLQVIYEEAWNQGIIERAEFGLRSVPLVLPDTVRLNPEVHPKSNYSGEMLDPDLAYVVMTEMHDDGDSVEAHTPYIVDEKTTFRVPFRVRVPLTQFDYAQALREEWFTPEAGQKFVGESGCFEFEGIPVLSAEEAYQSFFRQVPGLILRHNLHGIDIDLRCTQIAALALWLRCQSAYQVMGFKKDRPRITRSNIVCAEPMPGEGHILTEFVNQIEPKLLGQLVEVVFDKMKLAGEAGSLLKIEEEIREAVSEARRQWRVGPLAMQMRLFGDQKPVDRQERFDLSGITDIEFFEQAETKVVDALRSYAEEAQNGQRLQRRLFTDDAVQGFAFVDLCHKRFDVVLMNPPFGDPPKKISAILDKSYKVGRWDLSSAFVMRGIQFASAGSLGVISTRVPLFTVAFDNWREHVFINSHHLFALADLGGSVLDSAMVETAAYCLTHQNPISVQQSIFIPAYGDDRPEMALLDHSQYLIAHLKSFRTIPGFPLCYWLPQELLLLFSTLSSFEPTYGFAKQGLGTTDDFRFCRLRFEVPANRLANLPLPDAFGSDGPKWIPYVKGDSFSPYYAEFPVVVEWSGNGHEIKEYNRNSPGGRIVSEDYYSKSGLVFPRRTKRFVPRYYPAGMIFSVGGQSIFPNEQLLACLGYMSTALASTLAKAMLGRIDIDPQFEIGVVKRLPYPSISNLGESISKNSTDAIYAIASVVALDETTCLFVRPWGSYHFKSLSELVARTSEFCDRQHGIVQEAHNKTEKQVSRMLNLSVAADKFVANGFSLEREDFRVAKDAVEIVRRLLSYILGCAWGRMDVIYAISEIETLNTYNPFLPLQNRSPGMLQGEDGYPLTNGPNNYPLQIDGDGILVDDMDHADDIVRRVRDVFEVIWKDRADFIESEACEILGVDDLRDYFRKPGAGGFWDDHIRRYSKSRRKAPIYWLLQSSKKNYALWIYYHRLDKDILFKALLNYVEPKVRLEESRLEPLRAQRAEVGTSGKAAKGLEKQIEKQEAFLSELRDFEAKLRRAAELHLEPDLNDGVVLNIAPLRELVPWKEAKAYWDELLAGKYEWSSIGRQLREKGLVK